MGDERESKPKLTVSQEFSVLQPMRQNAYPIGEADWERIKRMIKEIVPPNNLYEQISFACLGVFGSSVLALASLKLSGTSPPVWAWVIVWCVFVGSLVATVTLYLAGKDLKKATARTAESALAEMMEIEQRCAPIASDSSSPASVPAEKAKLSLLSAAYGADGHGWSDVKPVLNQRIKDGKLCIHVTNEELGGDPVPNVWKKLRVAYRINGKVYRVEVGEGQKLSIPDLQSDPPSGAGAGAEP
jgi:hypothetical protein